ncbi:MAG: hypothetical protein JWR70_1268 [Modestobacter sp.]|nr:hypothetical protein [Modestobacter sp.]
MALSPLAGCSFGVRLVVKGFRPSFPLMTQPNTEQTGG